jgi:hypothetical protein
MSLSWIPKPSVVEDVSNGDVTQLQKLLPSSAEGPGRGVTNQNPAVIASDDLNGYLLDLVGMVIKKQHAPFVVVSLLKKLSPVNDNSTQNAICDALWYWGTQVRKSVRRRSLSNSLSTLQQHLSRLISCHL